MADVSTLLPQLAYPKPNQKQGRSEKSGDFQETHFKGVTVDVTQFCCFETMVGKLDHFQFQSCFPSLHHGEAVNEHNQGGEVHEPDRPGEKGGAEEGVEEEQEAEAGGESGHPEGEEPEGDHRGVGED